MWASGSWGLQAIFWAEDGVGRKGGCLPGRPGRGGQKASDVWNRTWPRPSGETKWYPKLRLLTLVRAPCEGATL